MALQNDFLPFATGGGANVLSQAAYAALSAVSTGYQSGVAQSAALNKTWRQASIMAAVLAQLINNNAGQPAVDDGTTATLLANLTTAISVIARQNPVLTDTGTANAYVVANAAALGAYPTVSGLTIDVSIANTNTGPSTLNVDGLGAKPILGLGLQPLQGGELPQKGVACLMYVVASTVNGGNGAWIVMECTGGTQQVASATQSQHALQLGQMFPAVSASVASNALTLTLTGPTALTFRNPTLSSGAPVVGSVASNLSITVPSGATLGTSNSVAAQLALIVAYNAGIPVLCVANTSSGSLNLDEAGLISPTTISGSSNSSGVVYSASAVAANSPYRVIGYVTVTEATAGTWSTAPSVVQGSNGLSVANLLGACAAFAFNLGSSGYQKLPSGLIIQWGTATPTTGGATITFPLAYPTTALATVAVSGQNNMVWVNANTNASFLFTCASTYSGSAYWISIGK
jgi:hypothetical protein